MTESLALLSEAEKLARVADEVGQTYATELARVLRELERSLRQMALEALSGKQTALSRAVRAGKMRAQVKAALKAAGYDSLAEQATGVGLDAMLVQVERLRGAARLAAFTSSDQSRILALKQLARMDVLGHGAEIAQTLWRTLMRGLFAQQKPADLMHDLAETLDVELYQARTLYDTTVNVFARQVEAMKSREGDVFAFLGPADTKLRPFCHAHVGKVFTREQIDALDNGQVGNVFLTGGGYNCRHQFVAVSKVSELRNLAGTNQRIPEVDAQLGAVGGKKAA